MVCARGSLLIMVTKLSLCIKLADSADVLGSSFLISVADLLGYVQPGVQYNLQGKYNQWKDKTRDDNGVITLYRCVSSITEFW